MAAKNKSKENDVLLRNLKAKFEWIKTQAEKLGIPPPPELSAFGLSATDKKRKRSSKILKEVFVQEDIIVDGMHRNLTPPQGVVGPRGLVLIEPEAGIYYYNRNFHLAFQRENPLSTKPQRAPQTYSSQRHRQGSRRLLVDILVSWDGYQLTTSSDFSPTPPRDKRKGKGIASEEDPMKEHIPLMDEGGFSPQMLNLHQFSTLGEKKLRRLSPAEIQTQAQELAEYEAKRKRMLEEYNHYITPHKSSNELEDLFFAHPTSLNIWRAFPDMLMDATYNTVRYPMPLLEIVGVTLTNQTFCIAFVFMHKKKEVNYDWAMECLRSVMDGYMLPRVTVTDRELALMKAYDTAFPNAKGLLCVVIYLNKYWLTQYKERFVAAWTDKFPHFGNQTTNRVESQHAKLKLYLDSAQSDLLTAVSYIHEVVNSQETAIHSSLEHRKIVIRHRYNVPFFTNLNKHISLHILDILFEEYTRCVDGLVSEICECQLRTSYGLPCSHEQLVYMNKGYPIPLEAIDRFWRKLNLSPCASLGDDDLGCQVKVEVENFNSEFKKKSRAATGGRISFKRASADQPSQTQKPAGYNFSSMPSFVGKDNFMNQKTRRHAYIDQFPNMLHTYIEEVRDVRADGNCGFRAVAVGLKLHENEWPTIRYDLMEELRIYYDQYVFMFGAKECDDVKKRLNFFENGFAPIKKWMNMPE
ncbi:FAR-RED impaired response 1-like protein [Tanacetum coccineum]